jgi:hypothetical protein
MFAGVCEIPWAVGLGKQMSRRYLIRKWGRRLTTAHLKLEAIATEIEEAEGRTELESYVKEAAICLHAALAQIEGEIAPQEE